MDRQLDEKMKKRKKNYAMWIKDFDKPHFGVATI